MEKVEQYRIYVQQVLTEYAQQWPANSEIDRQLVFDTVRDHYQLVYAGWKNRWRQYGSVVHLDIKGEKIWIQNDGTEVGIANELVKLGVPKSDIVLAFREPFVRKYTGFAVD